MLHSLKANLVNLQDENKPTLHADCYISTSPVEGVSYIPDAWAVACFSPKVLPEPAFIRQVDGPRFFYNSRYMGYNEFILIVNAASVIILLVMALLLCLAARFKGESSYAAMIIVVSTVPVYIYNVCRSLELYDVAICFAPIAFSVNLTLMPLLWLLVQRGFNPYYKFTPLRLLHFLPAVLSLILFCASVFSLPQSRYYDFMIHENTGDDTWLGDVNYTMVLLQLIGYFYAIFRYLRKVKHFVRNHYSAAELQRKVWIPRFIGLFAAMFVVVMVCYALWPRTDAWLLQLLTVIIMGYLLYAELAIALFERYRKDTVTTTVAAEAEAEFIATEVKPQPQPEADNGKEEMQKLEQYARQVEEYLRTSEVYVNPKLSLRDVSQATGITYNNISKAINATMKKNFFDLVNGFRIEKSKALLKSKKEKGYTLETIAEMCGFNSRITFNNAFKKVLGVTTTEWLRLNRDKK